jgi:glycosyltransferase involved in cell wall biosynthesis
VTPDPSAPSIDVVICTYQRADELDLALRALAAQSDTSRIDWAVLVVDNNSSDATAEVVDRHVAAGVLPGLRRVLETEQGLTPARRRGLLETGREWVAFVDDDNLLDPGWLAGVAGAVRDRPEVGAVGGRVVLDWPVPPPPYVAEFGFCYAEQDHGPVGRAVEHLNGAGMVLRRAALLESGWLDEPLLADRVGRRLVSGGDVEIAARVRACGYLLWYAPECVLRHRIEVERASRGYLLRVAAGLGAAEPLISLITWSGDYPSWRRQAWVTWATRARRAMWRLVVAALRPSGFTAAAVWTTYAVGALRGTLAVLRLDDQRRKLLQGVAAPRPPA